MAATVLLYCPKKIIKYFSINVFLLIHCIGLDESDLTLCRQAFHILKDRLDVLQKEVLLMKQQIAK